ncbi:hypothetical protein CHISP_0094 [Chitinispirillum alkaliphilum]|nr:hypothetical protein CHISP_0094 [Chitinispirillum alkaliphilum]
MVCSKWEESGFLYSSGELDQQKAREFEAHLKECSECESELKAYINEKNSLFTADVLGENPSEAVSKEIKRVCASGTKQFTGNPLFSLIAKKAAVSMLLLIIGFTTVSYIRLNSEQAQSMKSRLTVKNDTVRTTANAELVSAQDSALFDSLKRDSNANFSNTRGNMEMQGVVPVDLTDE